MGKRRSAKREKRPARGTSGGRKNEAERKMAAYFAAGPGGVAGLTGWAAGAVGAGAEDGGTAPGAAAVCGLSPEAVTGGVAVGGVEEAAVPCASGVASDCAAGAFSGVAVEAGAGALTGALSNRLFVVCLAAP